MYAIVEIAGQQFKVEKDQNIFVHRLDSEEGSKVNFDKVLLMDNAGKVNVGNPVVQGAQVTAKVIEHLKGDKVIVFKKKRRKGYKVKNGHRQYLTKLEILKIDTKLSGKKDTKSSATKEDPIKKTTTKETAAKKAPAKKTATKKAATKKSPAKKTVTKKAAAKKVPAKKTVAKNKAVKKDIES